MTFNLRTIVLEDQGKLRFRNQVDCNYAKDKHLLPLALVDFPAVAPDMPIAFAKNSETGQFQPVAVTGLQPGENLFVDKGNWIAGYVPQSLLVYPFTLIPNPQDAAQYLVGIDQNSKLLGDTEGELLMDAAGNDGEFFKERKQQLLNLHQANLQTKAFVEELVKRDLLVAQGITLRQGDKDQRLNGLYLVDEKKLNNLSNEDFLELRRRGFIPYIYAHILSLHQFSRLAMRKSQR